MTRYIKTKDGKFAGSIGAGTTNTPSPAPSALIPASTSTDSLSVEMYRIDPDQVTIAIGDFFDPLPDLQNPHVGTPGDHLDKPDLDTRRTWDSPPAQDTIDIDKSRTISLTATVNEDVWLDSDGHPHVSRNLATRLDSLGVYYHAYAQELWDKGHHHQASAYFTMSQVYIQGAEVEYDNLSRYANDENHLMTHLTVHDSLDHPESHKAAVEYCVEQCRRTLNTTSVKSLLDDVCTGAVVLDYLPHAEGNPSAAATMAALMGDPHENKDSLA